MATMVASLQTKEIDVKPVEGRQYLTELMELKTILWIASQYRQHWQVQREWFSGFSGGGGSSRIAVGADKRTEVVRIRIADLLKDNLYAAKVEEIATDRYIYLPQGTKAVYDRKNHFIEFDNAHMNMKITFCNVGGSALDAGVEADKLKANLQEQIYGRVWAGHFTVNFKITPKRIRRWSPSTKKQIAWAKDLVSSYDRAFSFSVLKQLIKEKL